MSTIMPQLVKDLSIDLCNFRTVAQESELKAIKAMISISPDYFWALMESLIDDGYLPTENIIVLLGTHNKMLVKEGNRRIASLKIILGQIDTTELNLPAKLAERVANVPKKWMDENSSVPCTVYEESEANVVDRIVTRTHGKGQKAGRDHWEAVARARHNKIANGASEPALELLEKYLEHGNNLTPEQKIRWTGKYNLTVLDEAIKKIALRFAVSSSPELAKAYPNIPHKQALDEIIYAVGVELLSFTSIRESTDFALRFGVPPHSASSNTSNTVRQSSDSLHQPNAALSRLNHGVTKSTQTSVGIDKPGKNFNDASASDSSSSADDGTGTTSSNRPSPGQPAAVATNDERSVKRALRTLKLFGPNRAKVETLRKEAIKLKLKDNPIAFCFLLRSMFEISAKAYCQDHSSEVGAPKSTRADGKDKVLSDVLRDIVAHLTQNGTDKEMQRLLHGPLTELQRKDGILSLTSMNQLVHNPSFTIPPSDIPTVFCNIIPLLEQINK